MHTSRKCFYSVLVFIFCFSLNGFAGTTKDVFEKYPNKYFVETGTWVGAGVLMALEVGFQEIHSIELSDYFYSFSVDRFKGLTNVHIWKGDSGVILSDIIAPINEPITFWLDGHWCGDDINHPSAGFAAPSYKGDEYTPLMRELEAIKAHPIKTHTIIIDDVRCFETYLFQGLSKKNVIKKIKEINPNYKIVYENGCVPDDVLVAYIE